MKLSPGSEAYDLHDSDMGHLMLPCSKFLNKEGRNADSVSFVVGECFQSRTSSSKSSTRGSVLPPQVRTTEYYDLAADDVE